MYEASWFAHNLFEFSAYLAGSVLAPVAAYWVALWLKRKAKWG